MTRKFCTLLTLPCLFISLSLHLLASSSPCLLISLPSHLLASSSPCLLASFSPLHHPPPFPSQDSLQVNSTALVDVTVGAAPHLTCYQFERVGYFCIDFDSSKDRVRRRRYACLQHNYELSVTSFKFVWHVSHYVLFIFTVGVQQDHWTERRLREEHQLIS